MDRFQRKIPKPVDKCPACGTGVVLKEEGGRLKVYELKGGLHVCLDDSLPTFVNHPIGEAVKGRTIVTFQLRGRVLTLKLDDGQELTVSAAGRPLSISMQGPKGILQE